ncbi:hypothetical protein PVK06_020571 [Gossypium arboreum]|uniref:Putative plant transposon protein domain-containing protein n=1 Tax=Gossypium arboreum TaxID=29729 RepID=A0ABR0PMQ6_GOSAR|nr:hypothetical protein PVK06_020571 [Gossypium arboreum]
MHLEKGFTLKESNYRDFMARIRQVVETLNWELFFEKRPSVDEELVCEFYANLTSSEITEIPIRGINVPINSNAINEFFELPDFKNDEYFTLMSNVKAKNLNEILEELTVQGSTWTVSNQRIHTCRREYLTPLAKVWFYFIRFNLKPSSHGTTISLERMVLLYSILTGKTIDVGKIILREIWNCAIILSSPAHFPFTITILCLRAEILANVRKTGYSQGTIIDWGLYRVVGDSILQQRVEGSEKPENPDEEDDPMMQSFEVPDKVESVEPEAKPDAETSIFRAQPPSPDLRDELSKLMDLMQHMQWQYTSILEILKNKG